MKQNKIKTKPMKAVEIDPKQINIESLFLKKYKNGKESKMCRINYGPTKSEFNVITPRSKVPFGLTASKQEEGETKPTKYSFEINLGGGDEKLDQFKEKLASINNVNVDYITKCSKDWWGKAMSRDSIADMGYESMIKADKKGTYPDRFKIKLPIVGGVPQFNVFDQNNKKIDFWKKVDDKIEIDWSWAKQQMEIEALIECEGLWIVDKKVYCTWKAKQIRFYHSNSFEDSVFEDPESGSDSAIDEMTAAAEKMIVSSTKKDKESKEDIEIEEDSDAASGSGSETESESE